MLHVFCVLCVCVCVCNKNKSVYVVIQCKSMYVRTYVCMYVGMYTVVTRWSFSARKQC